MLQEYKLRTLFFTEKQFGHHGTVIFKTVTVKALKDYL